MCSKLKPGCLTCVAERAVGAGHVLIGVWLVMKEVRFAEGLVHLFQTAGDLSDTAAEGRGVRPGPQQPLGSVRRAEA